MLVCGPRPWLDQEPPKVDLGGLYTRKGARKLSVFRNRGSLNQRVNLCCVPLIPDGDAKRHKVYTGLGNRGPTSSPRDRSCIPCTGVLVVGGYKLGERGSSSQVSVERNAGYRVRHIARVGCSFVLLHLF